MPLGVWVRVEVGKHQVRAIVARENDECVPASLFLVSCSGVVCGRRVRTGRNQFCRRVWEHVGAGRDRISPERVAFAERGPVSADAEPIRRAAPKQPGPGGGRPKH